MTVKSGTGTGSGNGNGNADKYLRIMGFVERIGLPGALLLFVVVGAYYTVAKPLVDLASENIQTQTRILQDIHSTVAADKAERKGELLAAIQTDLRLQREATAERDAKTLAILERMSECLAQLSNCD